METHDNSFKVQFAELTDKGYKRKANEDNCHCGYIWDDKHLLAIVVDGVGGYAGGEVAASIAVEQTVAYLEENREGECSRLMTDALVHANNCIFQARANEDRLYQMCCVMTAVLFDLDSGTLYMAHVGDTRLYAFSRGRIIKLSHDHSVVGRYEEEGLLSEDEAMSHPYRNMLDRAVGEKNIKDAADFVETNVFPMATGITWMLCSDGLSDMITSIKMASILDTEGSEEEKTKELVHAANEAGGYDNITVVVISATQGPETDAMQVMEDYALDVLPQRQEEYEPEVENEQVPRPEEHSQQEVQVHPEEPEPASRRFPWKLFVLFIITIFLAVATVWTYRTYSLKQEQYEWNIPSLQEQQEQYNRLYYNINNNQNHDK